jgi:hypothetical protein
MTKTEYNLVLIELKNQLDHCITLTTQLKNYSAKNQNYILTANLRNIEKTLLEKRDQLIDTETQP